MLKIKNLNVTAGGRNILSDLSLELNERDILIVFGPSGCGKSTLLNAVSGFIEWTNGKKRTIVECLNPTWFPSKTDKLAARGEIQINNQDVTLAPPEQRPVGLVLQKYGFYPHLTGYENIAFPLQCQSLSSSEIQKRVNSLAEKVGVKEHHLRMKTNRLSGGEVQRIVIAKMLAKGAPLALMDEPFSHLDQVRRSDLLELMHKLIHDQGEQLVKALVLVSHDWRDIAIANRVLLLNARDDGVPSAYLAIRDKVSGSFDFSSWTSISGLSRTEIKWMKGIQQASEVSQPI